MIKSVSFRFPCCFVSSLPVFSIIRHLIGDTKEELSVGFLSRRIKTLEDNLEMKVGREI